jgi:hypothetical protein
VIRGGSFRQGFAGGVLGGAVHYAGLRAGSARFDGAGLLGRQISSTGASLVRNASAEGRLTRELVFPVGPLHLYVTPRGERVLRAKVNVVAVGTVISAVANPEFEWDPAASLSAGAVVFRGWERSPLVDGRRVYGIARNGTIVVTRDGTPEFRAQVFAHERVHVLQRDWLFLVWGDAVERPVLEWLPGVRLLAGVIDVDIVAPLGRGFGYRVLGIDDRNTLHEIEATFLEKR